MPRLSSSLAGVLLLASACSGSINCGGCVPGGLTAIPGGFPDQAQLDRAAELRVTRSGLDFFGTEFGNLTSAYARMQCGVGEPIACPTNFVLNGQRTPSTCGPRSTCVGPTGNGEPVLGFEIERAVQSGATVCRDEPTDPNPRACFAWLRLEGLALTPVAPNQIDAAVRAQIYTTVIPIRYDPLGMDCVVNLDSNASGGSQQEFNVKVEIGPWTPPAGTPGGQLDLKVTDVTAMIPDGDISITRDPVHGDIGDTITCGIANLGAIKTALVGRIVGRLGDIIDDQIKGILAQRCGRPMDPGCPASTHCNADNQCEVDGSDEIVPQRLGLEGRLSLGSFLGGFGSATAGTGDLSGLVGGTAGSDATGVNIGLRAGMEVAMADGTCSVPGISPRLRPEFIAPVPFPAATMVDLDFDGRAERPFMIAAGISQPLLDQVIFTAAAAGTFCAAISTETTELVNTGSLAVLMPSLNQLTHADRYNWSIWPARISIRPTLEPKLIIGEGKTSGTSPNIALETPLITLRLPALELSFAAIVEERWVHLMTVTADVDVPLGLFAEPGGQIRLLVGDLANSVTNVHVADSEILAETAAELEMSVPALLSLVLPQLTSALAVPIALPSGSDLGGFEPTFLGARGVPVGTSTTMFSHLGIYVDLAFDPSLVPPLKPALDTVASVERWQVPTSEEMSIHQVGGPRAPQLDLVLNHSGPPGAEVEYQVRIDGGTWSPFAARSRLSLERQELLVQGRHQVEIRGREFMKPQSLDPTPAVIELVVDTEAPILSARVVPSKVGIAARAHDVVSRGAVTYLLIVDGVAREVSPDTDDFVAVPELLDTEKAIEIQAIDEIGNIASHVLRKGLAEEPAPAPQAEAASCASALPRDGSAPFALFALAFGMIALRRRAR